MISFLNKTLSLQIIFTSSITAIVLSNVLSVLQIRRFGKNYVYYVYVTDFNQVYVYKTYLFCSTKSSFKSTFVCKLIQGRLLGDRGKEKGLFVGHDRSKTFFQKNTFDHILLNTPLISRYSDRSTTLLYALISDDIKHQFIENF